jgi:hypothetical protein
MVDVKGHELVGSRLVGHLQSASMIDLWVRCTSRIVKYGFAIEYRDLEPPRTGIFDGLRIVLDPDVGFEMQCFILLHLFGHSVQWTAPSWAHKLDELQNVKDRTRFMQVLKEYEAGAAHFGLQLMHEAGLRELDQWFSDFAETDRRYVERYYETDRIPPWDESVASGCKLVEPWEIPPIERKQVEVRFAF